MLRLARLIISALTLLVGAVLAFPRAAVVPSVDAETGRITVVGDSLTVGTFTLESALEKSGWADARVDARLGRHINTSGDVSMSGILTIRSLRAAGGDTADWVVALGTNDLSAFTSATATSSYLQKVVDEIGPGHRIAFVALALPTHMEAAGLFNDTVRSWADADPGRFIVVDWDDTALGHPEWFAPDRVHMTTVGYAKRAAAITAALSVWLPPAQSAPVAVAAGVSVAGLRLATEERVIDTRIGLGLPRRLSANTATPVTLPDAPAGAAAAVLNFTTVSSAAAGFLSAGQCPTVGSTSVQNFGRNDVVAALAIVTLETSSFCVLASAPVELIVDVAGWLTDEGAPIEAVTPARMYDSRSGARSVSHRIPLELPAGSTGAVVNITVVSPAGSGYITASACGQPTAGSNANFSAGETVSNLAVVATGDGTICVEASSSTHIIVDLVGTISPAAATRTAPANTRVLDTRNGTGAPAGIVAAATSAATNIVTPLPATAAFVQVTATGTGADGYVTAYDCSNGRPSTSSVNTSTSVDRSNLAFVQLDGGDLCLFTSGRTHLVADVVAVLEMPAVSTTSRPREDR